MTSEPIKIVRQLLPWKPELGDVLGRDCKFVKCLFEEKMLTQYNPVLLTTIADFSWRALPRIGIVDSDYVQRRFQYACPWTNNIYYHFMPWLLLAEDTEKYVKSEDVFTKMAFDAEWTRDVILPGFMLDIEGTSKKEVEKDSITHAMLGHGYTEGTLPHDGCGEHMLACLELSNEDLIAGWLFVWFNK